MKEVKRFFCVFLSFVISAFWLFGCDEKSFTVSGADYTGYYVAVAERFGFENANVMNQGNSSGFLAFEGIFTVCFNCGDNDEIVYLEISTSTAYANTIAEEKDFHEALLWAAYLVMPFYLEDLNAVPEDTDVSTVAGMLLAAFDSPVPFERMECISQRDGNGFIVSLTLVD